MADYACRIESLLQSVIDIVGYLVNTTDGVSRGMWSYEESTKSSTWREIIAVYRVLLSLGHLKNQNVKWFTDNQAVKTIVHKGSMKQEPQDVAFSIFHLCISNSVHLDNEWIPRKENDQANYLSKIVDYDDWGLSWYI